MEQIEVFPISDRPDIAREMVNRLAGRLIDYSRAAAANAFANAEPKSSKAAHKAKANSKVGRAKRTWVTKATDDGETAANG